MRTSMRILSHRRRPDGEFTERVSHSDHRPVLKILRPTDEAPLVDVETGAAPGHDNDPWDVTLAVW